MKLECKTKNIKVLVDVSENEDSFRKTPIIDEKTGKKWWGAIELGYWNLLKPILEKEGYTFDMYYHEIVDYTGTVKQTAEGIYDLVIGSFSITKERLANKNITYSKIIWFEKNTILYFPKNNALTTAWSVFKDVLIYPISAFIFFGIFFGIIIYVLEPDRVNPAKNLYNKNSKSGRKFRRAILTTIVAFFGELGFIHENSGVTWGGIMLIVFIFIISFVVLEITSAFTTAEVLKITEKDSLTTRNLYSMKPLLCPKGNAMGKVFSNLGAKIKYLKVENMNKLVEYYINNKDDFGGITMSLTEGLRFQDPSINLEYAKGNFGFHEQAFIYNNKTCCDNFAKSLNEAIIDTQTNQKLYALCKKYYNDNETASALCLI